jgi:hypothetical protein
MGRDARGRYRTGSIGANPAFNLNGRSGLVESNSNTSLSRREHAGAAGRVSNVMRESNPYFLALLTAWRKPTHLGPPHSLAPKRGMKRLYASFGTVGTCFARLISR